MTDEHIQAEEQLETADEETLESTDTEIDDSPSEVAQPERDATKEETDDDGDDAEEEYVPFKHTVPYKADGEDREAILEYDKEGNLTPETIERLQQVYAKTGLEKVAQDKHIKWQEAERRAEANEARARFLETQLKTVEEQYSKPIDFIRQSPQVLKAMQQRGVKVPDIERIRFDREKAEVASTRRGMARDQFIRNVGQSVREKFPDLTDEQFSTVGEKIISSSTMRRLIDDPNSDLENSINDVLYETDLLVTKMRYDGVLPNPTLEQARKDAEAARSETQITKQRAQQRAATLSPLAVGRPKGGRGKGKKVDLTGMTAAQYASYQRTGKLPT